MNIKLYSSYGCPRCTRMKKILDKLNVEYEELDIDKNPKYREELDEKMGNADRIPVLEKDEKIIHIGPSNEEEIAEKINVS